MRKVRRDLQVPGALESRGRNVPFVALARRHFRK
jgi:hypothetical protein